MLKITKEADDHPMAHIYSFSPSAVFKTKFCGVYYQKTLLHLNIAEGFLG